MIESYLPSKRNKLSFDMSSDVVSGQLRILDEGENVLLDYTLSEANLSGVAFNYIVDSAINSLSEDKTKGIRLVTLNLVDLDEVTHSQNREYYIIRESRLVPGENSFGNYAEVLMEIPDLSSLEGWYAADQELRKTALVEAYEAIGLFNLSIRFDPYINSTSFTREYINSLEVRIKRQFLRAQILHADYLLDGQPEKKLRDTGIISRSVGESTSFFRTTKQLNLGISDRAFAYISVYVDRSVRLVNG